MKTKKARVALKLNKETIASLNQEKMGQLKGGADTTDCTNQCATVWLTNCTRCTEGGTCDNCISAIPLKCWPTYQPQCTFIP